ncbi:acyltransferase family protein [Actinosynnema sp. NPDC023587]|uniref:acyltransferase family protein n=1 Tax=Actinosynnema sp. NPDC023587 TaxID=3154695 RepID=UPI0034119E96
MTVAQSARADATPTVRLPVARFRPEIQGLRAVAVALVVVYHVWLGRVSGGVDVFFVISGFLVTGQLLRATDKGRIAFVPLWGRMIKRLFPAALTVLLAVLVASYLLLPGNRWFQTIREVVAAALYLENWQLAADSADYFAQHNSASVVQHFWSLSIQGQFFVVWPLLAAAALVLGRLTGRGARQVLRWALIAVLVESLVFSVALTMVDQPLAYFHSLTRAWEFALGGLLAFVADRIVLTRASRVVLGWVGLVGLVACGLVLQVGTVFPGYLALWPTLCGAAVVVAGTSGSGIGVDRVLGTPALKYLGDVSYSLYLWHWPVLVLFLVTTRQEAVDFADGALVIGVSVALAVATHHLVEQPVRRSAVGVAKPWGAYRFGLLLMVPVLVVAGTWQVVTQHRVDSYSFAPDPDHPGALAHRPGFEYEGSPDAEVVPPLEALRDDVAAVGPECLNRGTNEDVSTCAYRGDGEPVKRIVVVGDSHMHSYLPAFEIIAERRDWEFTTFFKGGCPLSTDSYVESDEPLYCPGWSDAVVGRIIDLKPDLVILNGSRNVRRGLTEETPDGFVAQWRRLDAAGIPLLAFRDNPRFDVSPAECLAINGLGSDECDVPRAEVYGPPPYERIADLPAGIRFADFGDYFCDASRCGPAVGNVYIYGDHNHLGRSYVITLTPVVEDAVATRLAG